MSEELSSVLSAMQQLQQNFQTLLQENDMLRNSVNQLKATIPAPSAIPLSTTSVSPRVSLPDKFDGSRLKFRGFINQVRLIIRMQPAMYHNDELRVGLLGSLLSGPALSWFAPLLENESELLRDFELFILEFEATFGDSDKIRTASNKIRSLTQGSRPASAYASEFHQIACDLDWGESALISQFNSGLKGDVKDLLLSLEDPASLNQAISMVVRCDNCLFERRQERHLENPFRPSIPQTSSTPPDDPMQVDTVRFRPLTPAERERRRSNNLCLYCGRPGHIINSCPNRRSNPPRVVNITLPSGNGQVQLQ